MEIRNIAFKAKRKDNGEWVEGYYRADPDLDTHYICGWNYYASENGLEREPFSLDTHTDKSTVENTIRKIKKRAGIECGCYPHKFRRTCATMALRRGMPIEQVSKMLGHESIETTQIYLDLNEQDLAEAHKNMLYKKDANTE